MDNRVFNVNGSGKEDLLQVLKVACKQGAYDKEDRIEGYSIDKNKGLILHWCKQDSDETVSKFPSNLTAEGALDMVWAWLENSKTWEEMEFEDWDKDADHDGHNRQGWRVYCERWGHVNDDWSAIVAIRPAYMWYGK